VVQFRRENKTVKKNVAKHGIILRICQDMKILRFCPRARVSSVPMSSLGQP